MIKGLLRASVNVLPMWLRRQIKHIPALAAAQRSLVDSVLSGEAFVHTINAGPAAGLRFEVTLPEDKAIWAGTFEPDFSQALHDATHKGDVCYDIGGYRGYMSGVFALAGAKTVIVFEPLFENVSRLKRLSELNPHLPIQIERTAIGAVNGEAHFKVMPDQSMGKLSVSTFQAMREAAREDVVPIARLDSYVFEKKLPPPNVIKIDVEGAESDVLDGATRTLVEYRPEILLEAHSETLAECCRQNLVKSGYDVRELRPSNGDPNSTRHLLAKPL